MIIDTYKNNGEYELFSFLLYALPDICNFLSKEDCLILFLQISSFG